MKKWLAFTVVIIFILLMVRCGRNNVDTNLLVHSWYEINSRECMFDLNADGSCGITTDTIFEFINPRDISDPGRWHLPLIMGTWEIVGSNKLQIADNNGNVKKFKIKELTEDKLVVKYKGKKVTLVNRIN